MARAYPSLQQLPQVRYAFPWAQETFADFLASDSPWLLPVPADVQSAFRQIAGVELSAPALAACSRLMEAAFEQANGLAAYAWKNLSLRQQINGINVAYFTGHDLAFPTLLEGCDDLDLVILHEPFQLTFPGPHFPRTGLEHLAPSSHLLVVTHRYLAALNPDGLRHRALHIRRGDYAQWHNGDFFFEDAFWLDLCRQYLAKKEHVTVFTNETDSPLCLNLAALGAHISRGSASEDMVRMMHMDCITGPPSTFTVMARLLAKSCLDREIEFEGLPAKSKASTCTPE